MICVPSKDSAQLRPQEWITTNIEVYRDLRKIWGAFLDSNYEYEGDILAKIISMDRKTEILIDLGAKFG